jgi:hypothetical protein
LFFWQAQTIYQFGTEADILNPSVCQSISQTDRLQQNGELLVKRSLSSL